jgi:dinuclear metal center YbgI/SA1388 family protein
MQKDGIALREIIKHLEDWAPRSLQESYDNSGLQVGDANAIIRRALICLDITPEVIDEAQENDCELIIAHHPLIFRPLKKLTGSNLVERCVEMAIRKNIALYAIHTNLDNVYSGVNAILSQHLGLLNTGILQTGKSHLMKLVVFVPHANKEELLNALFAAGAGSIGDYDECSFLTEGTGSFRAGADANPTVGKHGERHYEPESRVEVIFDETRKARIVSAMKQAHPYEEVAYDIIRLENVNPLVGAGMIGELPEAMEKMDFLAMLKQQLGCNALQFTAKGPSQIRRVALCGGSGSFLISTAKAAGADAFITGDITYHSYFDATESFMIVNVGHYESEQFTPMGIDAYIKKKLPTFATLLSKVKTNPVNTL